jgi:HEAT repeat protein
MRRCHLILLGFCLSQAANGVQPPSLKTQAWELLHEGIQAKNTGQRTVAVRVLSLLRGQPEAVRLARIALSDDKPEVRAGAAMAIGELHDRASIPKLKDAISDKDAAVVLAAAHALLQMKDRSAYQIYYAILTGERHSGKTLIKGQMDTLKDPKKMAMLGFQQGIGFIPFASVGYGAIRTLLKDDSSPIRAAAAKILAQDPDPNIDDALVQAATMDKSELVRIAALDAIAKRGHSSLATRIAPAMADGKDAVKYTAAAAVVRLSSARHRSISRPVFGALQSGDAFPGV